MRILFTLLVTLLFSGSVLRGNNLQITNVTATTGSVTFEISWNNSWNVQNLSRDAAWVFVKYQDCGSTNKSWDHLNLASSGHSIGGSLLQIDVVSDNKGVFIRRSAFGGGDNPATQVTLAFQTAFSDISQVNFDVVGVEMVYVPQGAFYSSDGASNNRFGNNATGAIREINTEAEIPANGLSNVGGSSSSTTHLRHPAVIANFPKGYNGFYCMKYEITQGQYVHFLNSLPATQQSIRTQIAVTSPAGTHAMHDGAAGSIRRNRIKIITPAAGNPMTPAVYGVDQDNDNIYNEANDGHDIACNFLNWGDLLAYLDWAALRPMTELEYEKACRGPVTAGNPIAGEFPWGSTTLLHTRAQLLTNVGLPSEVPSNTGPGLANISISTSGSAVENANNNNANGPIRVGFAASNGTSRAQAGATFYGIMEMTGNVREQCVAIGSIDIGAAIFEGVLGDGALDDNGDANQASWGSANEAKWSVLRGGAWGSMYTSEGRTSDRTSIGNTGGANRSSYNGGRGVRQF